MSNVGNLLTYDPSSPTGLRWLVGRGNDITAGTVAGWVDSNGYYMVTCEGRQLMVSRTIWELVTGEVLGKSDQIDHIDGNPRNNVVANLRKVTAAVNSKNRRKRSDNKTGFVGVSKQDSGGGRYYIVAQFNVAGKMVRKRWPVKGTPEGEVVAQAVAWRASLQDEMLAEGYTTRHINGNA